MKAYVSQNKPILPEKDQTERLSDPSEFILSNWMRPWIKKNKKVVFVADDDKNQIWLNTQLSKLKPHHENTLVKVYNTGVLASKQARYIEGMECYVLMGVSKEAATNFFFKTIYPSIHSTNKNIVMFVGTIEPTNPEHETAEGLTKSLTDMFNLGNEEGIGVPRLKIHPLQFIKV